MVDGGKEFNMLKKFFVFALCSMALFFTGCSNLLDTEKESNYENSGKFVISLGLKGPGTRMLRAFDYELSEIETWTLTFTDEKNTGNSFTATASKSESSESENSGTNVISASCNKDNTMLSVKMIPEGTYTVELEGSFSDIARLADMYTYKIYGNANGVEISSDSTGSAKILLGPKSSSDGTGSLELTLKDAENSDESISKLISSLKITLTNLIDSGKTYIYDASETDKSKNTLSLAGNKLTGSEISSGWYKINFSAGDTYRLYMPENPDKFIEIADEIPTTKTVEILAEKGKTYYVTNNKSDYNGLAADSRINLTTLLKKFSSEMPAEGNIFIRADEIPEIDIASFNAMESQINGGKKKIIIYNNDNEVLAAGDGVGNSTKTLSNSITLNATISNTEFAVNKISLTGNMTITLKEGASIDASIDASSETSLGDSSDGFKINIYAAANEEDNLSAYSSTPFIKAGQDISSYISLFKYNNKEMATDFAVISESQSEGKVYSFYIKPAGNAELTPISYAETAITSYLSGDKTTSFDSKNNNKTVGIIPYANKQISFELSVPDGIEVSAYKWFLNENAMGDATTETKTTEINPYESTYIEVDGTNVISCFFTVNGTTYTAEYKFTFVSAETPAVYFDGINASSSQAYALKYVADYSNTNSAVNVIDPSYSTSNDSYTTALYCFDANYNLWTAPAANTTASALTKYSSLVSTGAYSTSKSINISSIEGIVDICYEIPNDVLYILAATGTSGTIYEVSTDGNVKTLESNITLPSESSVAPTQIAVYDTTFYIAGDDCNIYKATKDASTLGDFSQVAKISTDENGDTSNFSITDLQIGDGLGNETGTLYVLAREYYIYGSDIKGDDSTTSSNYSRGKLVAINTTDFTKNNYGWTGTFQTAFDNGGNSCNLYAPSDSSSDFYGPTHFAAVVPKKLVILDDGVTYSGNKGELNNKDSIVEFDIESKALSRGAAVSATEVAGSGFTIN